MRNCANMARIQKELFTIYSSHCLAFSDFQQSPITFYLLARMQKMSQDMDELQDRTQIMLPIFLFLVTGRGGRKSSKEQVAIFTQGLHLWLLPQLAAIAGYCSNC